MVINKDGESMVIGEANEKEMEHLIKHLSDSISKDKEENIKRKYREIIDDILDLNSGIDLKNIEKYNAFVSTEIDDILKVVVSSLNSDISSRDKIDKLYLLYKHYDYLKNNIERLISAKESFRCSADKSRWLLNGYKDYIINGSIPNMDIEEKCYWKPKFGSGITWMRFCDGLLKLYYGNPEKYLRIMKELIKANRG